MIRVPRESKSNVKVKLLQYSENGTYENFFTTSVSDLKEKKRLAQRKIKEFQNQNECTVFADPESEKVEERKQQLLKMKQELHRINNSLQEVSS